MTCKFYNRPSF